MNEQRKSIGPEGDDGPPAWIVSFTDMVTLLLAFFVLLQAFSHIQDPELFFIGRDSFRRAIAGLGLPNLLLGKPEKARFDERKRKHPTDEAKRKIPKNRVLDAEDEKIRMTFKELRQSMETQSFDTPDRLLDKRVTPIAFGPVQTNLDASGRAYLKDLARDLWGQLGLGPRIKVHVIGFASDASSPRSQWLLSARRAQAVREYLSEQVGIERTDGNGACEFFSWGAGKGGKWREQFGHLPDQSCIVIIVTAEGE
ncbi:MAG: flagellar motor protein MotB [Planctomycetota bacterium]|jgi:chemotaxis protein MotB